MVIKTGCANYDGYAASVTLAVREVIFFTSFLFSVGNFWILLMVKWLRNANNLPYMKQASLIKLLLKTCLQPTLCLEQDKFPSSIGPLCLTDEATLSTALLVFDLFAELQSPALCCQ